MPSRSWSCCRVAAAIVALGLLASSASAQSISTFTGATSESWTTSGNWSPSGIPNGTSAWAQINSSTVATLRIFYASSSLSGTTLNVGAISFLPTLNSAGSTFSIQNNGTTVGQIGTLKFYGVDTTVASQSRRYILVNSSTFSNVQFTQTNAGQAFELNTSGAIYVAGNTTLSLSTQIREAGGARAITKAGPGTLAFGGSGNLSDTSNYTGGFTLEEGTVSIAASGGSTASPFGTGTLTLRSGTIRSSGSTSRSINTNVLLDGTVTLGSTVVGQTGGIDVNSASGTLSTTIQSDSVVSIASATTSWAQATSGAGGLTKSGAGVLRFSGVGGPLTHSGSTVVQEGTLIMNGNLSSLSALSVLSGATLFGTGTVAGATSILAGGTFSPGAASGTAGLISFGAGGLTLGGQTILEISGTTRGVQFDAVNLTGGLTYGGALSLVFSGTMPTGTYDLFSGFASQAGGFSSITLTGSYAGTLTEAAGVWTGSFGDQTLIFTNATGSLMVVPEPSAAALVGLGVASAFGGFRVRKRRLTAGARDAQGSAHGA